MTTTTSNVGTPGAKEDSDPTIPNLAIAEPGPPQEATESPTGPEVQAAAEDLNPVAGADGDATVGVVGDTTGWWVVAKSPRAKKRLGPYGMMESLKKANQLRAILLLQGKLKA